MKKLKLIKVIAASLICSSLVSVSSITARADSYENGIANLYEKTYNIVMQVEDVASANNVAPRYADDGGDISSNNLKDLVNAVQNGDMQNLINQGRDYLKEFPKDMWQARNTFSSILDGYQQPSYEYIVNIAVKLEKQTVQDSKKFDISSKWNTGKVKAFCKVIKQREIEIQQGRALNKNIDPTYASSYSTALDAAQQRIINLVTNLVEKATATQNSQDISNAASAVEAFRSAVYDIVPLRRCADRLNTEVVTLQDNLNKDVTKLPTGLKDDLDAMQYEIDELAKVKTTVQLKKQLQTLKDLQFKISTFKGIVDSGDDYYNNYHDNIIHYYYGYYDELSKCPRYIDKLAHEREDLNGVYEQATSTSSETYNTYFDVDKYNVIIQDLNNTLKDINTKLNNY